MIKPKVSIVILAWNNVTDIRKCVESIQSYYQEYHQLIIVDNGSTDGTAEYLSNLRDTWNDDYADLNIITNSENIGYAAGNNRALESIKGDYILWLNQDIVITQKSIEILTQCLDNNSQYAMVAPQLRYPDGRIQASCRTLPTVPHMIQSIRKGQWDDDFDYTKSQVCEQPMASAIMIRSEIMQEIKGFDAHPDYWLFFNDVDLSKTLQVNQYVTYYVAESLMYHDHGGSTRKLLNIKKRLYWQKGFNRYFRKWHYPRRYKKYSFYMISGLLFSLLVLRDFVRK